MTKAIDHYEVSMCAMVTLPDGSQTYAAEWRGEHYDNWCVYVRAYDAGGETVDIIEDEDFPTEAEASARMDELVQKYELTGLPVDLSCD